MVPSELGVGEGRGGEGRESVLYSTSSSPSLPPSLHPPPLPPSLPPLSPPQSLSSSSLCFLPV